VLQNVLVGNHHRTRTGLVSALLRPGWVAREEQDSREKSLEILALFKERLLPRINEPAESLSYANQRRLEIARALVSGPELLLLDEPTAGMNPHETQGIVDLIYQLKDRGHTVFLIEHKMRVVMTISDRVIVLDHGEKIAEGKPDEIAANDEVAEAYMGRRDRRASFD
jgi:ABC-type branched-subunit amino acid transport system ATPase component